MARRWGRTAARLAADGTRISASGSPTRAQNTRLTLTLVGSILGGFWRRKSGAGNSVRSPLKLRLNRRLNDTPRSALSVSRQRGSEAASAAGTRRPPLVGIETAIAVSIPTGPQPGP